MKPSGDSRASYGPVNFAASQLIWNDRCQAPMSSGSGRVSFIPAARPGPGGYPNRARIASRSVLCLGDMVPLAHCYYLSAAPTIR